MLFSDEKQNMGDVRDCVGKQGHCPVVTDPEEYEKEQSGKCDCDGNCSGGGCKDAGGKETNDLVLRSVDVAIRKMDTVIELLLRVLNEKNK